MMYEVIDDFLDPGYYEALEEKIMSDMLNWHCTKSNYLGRVGMSHTIVDMDEYESHQLADITKPLLCMLNTKLGTHGVIRGRLENIIKTNDTDHHPHVDFVGDHVGWSNFKTAIFNFSDCGYTTIFNERRMLAIPNKTFTEYKKVESKRNRVILIDGDRYHSGPTEVECFRRVVLNANFYTKKQTPAFSSNNGERM